jgi:phosphoinositide-3-kinase regulatory subunit 4
MSFLAGLSFLSFFSNYFSILFVIFFCGAKDNPAAFSYFFDTSGRRTCCIAPERFYMPSNDGLFCLFMLGFLFFLTEQPIEGLDDHICRYDGKVTPAMDMFSLGFVPG